MFVATLAIDPTSVVAPVRRRLFGSFVEHLGRSVYTGLFEPGHPAADEDGIGPVDQRPRRRDLARQVEAALDVHEYLNHPHGTHLSDLRRANGRAEPYGIRMWCLGNELDGAWQIGQKTAEECGRLAASTARALRAAQPDIELVACGSSGSSMPTFGRWEATLLEVAYDAVDFISCHAYYEEIDGDVDSFLASSLDLDHVVHTVVSTADSVGARLRSPKRILLSFDEWNVWYLSRHLAAPVSDDWAVAPRVIEDAYTVTDAVVVGSLLIALLRNSDRVAAACLAQLVNVIAPIRTEPNGPAWRQTTFHPFALTSRLARGNVLSGKPRVPSHNTVRYGDDVPRHATNTAAEPDRVAPRAIDGLVLEPGRLAVVLPALSWSAIRLRSVPVERSGPPVSGLT